MPRQVLLPTQDFTGARSFGPLNVPPSISGIRVEMSRDEWLDPADKVALSLELSFDNGATWQPWGAFTAQGGAVLDKQGNVATFSAITVDLPQPEGSQRRIRGEVVFTGTVRSALTIETA
jgi:hypothetical protein